MIRRYKVNGITVDVMPTSEEIPGFGNSWHKPAFITAPSCDLGQKVTLKLFRPEYFLASKFDAFKGRGKNGGRTSTDFEDMVYLFNNRTTLWQKIEKSDILVKEYFLERLKSLLTNRYIKEWISGHLERSEQGMTIHILENMARCVAD